MRIIASIILILTTGVSFSQSKKQKVVVDVQIIPETILVTLKSDSDSLTNCKVQILDSRQNVAKLVDLPKAAREIKSQVDIKDLTVGNYTCVVFKGKEELYKKDFISDAFFMEPQPQPGKRN